MPREIRVEGDADCWKGLESEARRQGIPLEWLLEHAALLYLAESDSGITTCIPGDAADLLQHLNDMLASALLIDCGTAGSCTLADGTILDGFTPVRGEFRVSVCPNPFGSQARTPSRSLP